MSRNWFEIAALLFACGCTQSASVPEAIELTDSSFNVSHVTTVNFDEPDQLLSANAAAFTSDGSRLAVLYNHSPPLSIGSTQSIRLINLSGEVGSSQVTFRLGRIDSRAYHVTAIGNSGAPHFTGRDVELLAVVPRWSPEQPFMEVIDVFTGTTAFQFQQPLSSPVSAWSFSAGGELLAVCGERMESDPVNGLTRYVGGTVHLWESDTGNLLWSDSWENGTCRSAAISTDRAFVAVGTGTLRAQSTSGEVRLYDALTGNLVDTSGDYLFPAEAVMFTPDGSSVISAAGGTIEIWEQSEGGPGRSVSMQLMRSPWRVSKMAVSSNGRLLAVALSNYNRGQKQGEIRLIDVVQRVQVGKLWSGYGHPVDYVAFSPDGDLLVAQGNEELTVWRISESSGNRERPLEAR